ncbi:MAG: hypothetical protein IKI64_09625, partial [Clostridia bacterium]|nr:hypothetical protein [Clostridia bacterium]
APQTAGRLKITFAYSAPFSRSLSARVTMSLNTVTVLGLTIRFSRCCALFESLIIIPLSPSFVKHYFMFLFFDRKHVIYAFFLYKCLLFYKFKSHRNEKLKDTILYKISEIKIRPCCRGGK